MSEALSTAGPAMRLVVELASRLKQAMEHDGVNSRRGQKFATLRTHQFF